ncbi:trehalose-phosphatase [Halobellus sp. GM3]|uniref:trehalose-phosphatase n=1 Tax=Halobellus sp. GM3 TaxID=3458410 RepID=UPI00403D5D1F
MTDAANLGTPPLDDAWLRTLGERLTEADGLLACFDFDGTLAPIVEDPSQAAIRPAIRTALRCLADRSDAAVAVVSGRSLSDLRERVGVDGVHYAGNHGLEWDDGSGRSVLPSARPSRSSVGAAVESLRDELDGVDGATVEDKSLTATVHYRRTPPGRVPDVIETTADVVESVDDVRLTRGKQIVELRPDVPAGKGLAVERLRERHPNALPLFVGDDRTDEDGFRAVAADGYGVLVGDRTDSAAAVRVPDVDGVATLLEWLCSRTAP